MHFVLNVDLLSEINMQGGEDSHYICSVTEFIDSDKY